MVSLLLLSLSRLPVFGHSADCGMFNVQLYTVSHVDRFYYFVRSGPVFISLYILKYILYLNYNKTILAEDGFTLILWRYSEKISALHLYS